jgi:hypothetical protein
MNKEFKKPDLSSPRCKAGSYQIIKKINNQFSKGETHSFLKEFIEKYPEYENISMDDALNILTTFHGKLWDHALNSRDGVELPEGLGYIFLGTCASAKKYNTDFGASIKMGVTVRHRNFESDNCLGKIFYTNFASKYKFKNREMWFFTATRDFKRSVSKVYPQNWKLYVQVESGKNISKYLKTARKNDYYRILEKTFTVDESYNEFDLN